MRYHHSLLTACLFGSVLALTGCQQQLTRPVAEDMRDSSGQFDSQWQGQVWSTISSDIQHMNMGSTVRTYCDRFADDLNLSVSNGWVTATVRSAQPLTFKVPVSTTGEFYGVVDVTGGKWFVDGSLPIFTSKRHLVISGVFNSASNNVSGYVKTTPVDENVGCRGQFVASRGTAFHGAPQGLPGYTGSGELHEVGGDDPIIIVR